MNNSEKLFLSLAAVKSAAAYGPQNTAGGLGTTVANLGRSFANGVGNLFHKGTEAVTAGSNFIGRHTGPPDFPPAGQPGGRVGGTGGVSSPLPPAKPNAPAMSPESDLSNMGIPTAENTDGVARMSAADGSGIMTPQEAGQHIRQAELSPALRTPISTPPPIDAQAPVGGDTSRVSQMSPSVLHSIMPGQAASTGGVPNEMIAAFRRAHGSAFNSHSAMDRWKMQQLMSGNASVGNRDYRHNLTAAR